MKTMCKEIIWPNATTYNAAISSCEKGRRWVLALELLEECKTWSMPDTISYNAAISACEKGRQWHHTLVLLKTMCKEKV